MSDGILEILTEVTNQSSEPGQDVTLIVDGFLVSGKLTSWQSFIDHHPITKALEGGLQSLAKAGQPADEEKAEQPVERTPRFVHLADARIVLGDGKLIPNDGPLFLRIRIEQVSGFFFGTLVSNVS